MSTVVMAAVWPLQMPPTAKSVLVSLADNANDQGHCWPSLTTIAERTCLSRRAVIDAVAYLERSGALSRVRGGPGKSTYYVVTPSAFDAQASQESPRQAARVDDIVHLPHQGTCRTSAPAAPTGAPAALDIGHLPHPNRKENRKEPSEEKRASRAQQVERPDDVAEIVWADFIALRRAKRAPLTQTALDGIRREADKAGVLLGEALSVCCERGWQGFRSDWYSQAPAGKPRQSAAVESFLALTGRSRNQQPDAEVIDVSTSFLLR